MVEALILGVLSYGAHQYMDHRDDDKTVEYTNRSENISELIPEDNSIAKIDWSKAGNFKSGDVQDGIQWVIVTN